MHTFLTISQCNSYEIDLFIAEMNKNVTTLDLKPKSRFINVANLQLMYKTFFW
jgi:hypothetical protein